MWEMSTNALKVENVGEFHFLTAKDTEVQISIS